MDALASLVDLDRYPLHLPEGPGLRAAVARARAGLAHDGCAVLKGFVPPAALGRMAADGIRLRHRIQASARPWYPYPPYQSPGGGGWPAGHPRRHRQRRCNRFVAGDLLAPASPLLALYRHPAFVAFVARVAGCGPLHPYGDPLGACALSLQEAGEALPWHFDVTHFVVSLLLVAADRGGRFHYAPRLRSEGCENYPAVARLLAGGGDYVDLDLAEGDLQLFEGRCSMHRVTAPGPGSWRCMALLSYCDRPGVIGSAEVQVNLYGRADRRVKRWPVPA